MGFSGQEYWSGLPFPSPGDLPNPGIEPRSPALQADALTSEPPGKQPPSRKMCKKKQDKYLTEIGKDSNLSTGGSVTMKIAESPSSFSDQEVLC